MLVIEAPMGSGKTEAALLAAEVMAGTVGSDGVLVALPTMATSNPMFSRVQHWLTNTSGARHTTLNLVHGKAALNDDYRSLRATGQTFVGIDDGDDSAGVYVASWFLGRWKAGLASNVVCTIDQVLFAALRHKHVMLRQLGLTNKVVIIDEVHAADEFMRVYLEAILRWLGTHRVPVILMSATLPPLQRHRLVNAYAQGFRGSGREIDVPVSTNYPRLTLVQDSAVDFAVGAHPEPLMSVEFVSADDSPDSLVSLLRDQLAGGGCAGVICSTVARAQERYRALKDADLGEVVLVHSKFVAPHRAARERDLVQRLGPEPGWRPERLIVVGTQVLEQSLDIDFDVMVSDIAPIDLLLQRIGRLHRHERRRPEIVSTSRCFVTGVTDWTSTPPSLDRGVVAVYGAWLPMSALATLDRLPSEVRLPDQIPSLVAEGYDPLTTAPEGWSKEWQRAYLDYRGRCEDQAANAKAFVVCDPKLFLTLSSWADELASDPESPQTAGRARVRDTDESVEVLMVTKDAAGNVRLLDGVGPMSGRLLPSALGDRDAPLARAAAACTVSLPRSLTADPTVLDRVIADLEDALDTSGWQDSVWLKGELCLVLDEAGYVTVADRRLHYDTEVGLVEIR